MGEDVTTLFFFFELEGGVMFNLFLVAVEAMLEDSFANSNAKFGNGGSFTTAVLISSPYPLLMRRLSSVFTSAFMTPCLLKTSSYKICREHYEIGVLGLLAIII